MQYPMWRLICLFWGLPWIVSASTGDSIRYLLPHDTLYLTVGMGEMLATHTVASGQTLFSLARFYGLTTEELKFYNVGMSDALDRGQQVRVPIPPRAILRFKPDTFYRWAHAPIYYRIRPGDTVFGLSKRFFKLPQDSIYQRLDQWNGTLRVGQLFFVGWIRTDGIPRSYQDQGGHPLFRENHKLRRFIVRYVNEGKRKYEHSGAARWSEDDQQNNHYALHDRAPLDSYILVQNPMKKRHIYAKVVGRLPRSTPPNVLIVLTAHSAKLLGARDPQFFVEIEYYK